MDEITPDMIARMASRIYNQAPTSGTPSLPAGIPSVAPPSLPGMSSMPSGMPGGMPGGMPTGMPSAPPTAMPSTTPSTGSFAPGSFIPSSVPAGASPSLPEMHNAAMPSSSASYAPPARHVAPLALSPSVPLAAPYALPGTPPQPNPHGAGSLGHGMSLSPLTTAYPVQQTMSRGEPHAQTHPHGNSATRDGLRAFVTSLRQPFGARASSSNVHHDQSDLKHTFAIPNPTTHAHSSRPLDVPAIREDFPILRQQIHDRPLAWFDNAATTQKPQSVIDAISRFYEQDNSNIHRGAHTLAARATDAYEQARKKVQSFLGAGSINEIVFVRGTTEGINLIAQTYGRKFLQPGDEIVLSMLEHHANIVPWQMIAKEKGANLRVIPVSTLR